MEFKKHSISVVRPFWIVCAIPFALGTGLPVILVVALLGASFDWKNSRIIFRNLRMLGGHELLFALFLIVFLTMYFALNSADLIPKDTVLSRNRLSEYYFLKVIGASLFVGLSPLMIGNTRGCLYFIGALALGAFSRALLSVLLSIYLGYHIPLYSSVFDLSTLNPGNSPGVANMLILASSTMLALIGNSRSFNLSNRSIFCLILLWSVSIISGLLLGSRTFNLLALLVSPLLCFFNIFLEKPIKIHVKSLLLIVAGLVFLFYLLNTSFLFVRPINFNLFSDGRFFLYKSFFNQIISYPLLNAQVPTSFGYVQFHNFFADVQRVSGTWALLTSVILVVYIFVVLANLIRRRSPLGRYLFSIAFLCLMVICTSVEPEGGGQNFLMLVAVGACAVVASKSGQGEKCDSTK